MELTDEVKNQVRSWLAEGDSLSQVQTKLKSACGIDMTYLDVRLLVLDIGAEVKDRAESGERKAEGGEGRAEGGELRAEGGELNAEGEEPEAEPSAPFADEAADAVPVNVTMSVDKIVIPGAMVSGSATFSDGVTARWYIDQYGRFGLDAQDAHYRPSDEDMREFQRQLRAELQRQGRI